MEWEAHTEAAIKEVMGKCMYRLGVEEKWWETEDDLTRSRHHQGSMPQQGVQVSEKGR